MLRKIQRNIGDDSHCLKWRKRYNMAELLNWLWHMFFRRQQIL